ncbi:MAG TPA: hypothetical protein VN238_22375 [Solirubrobacteraceae bacterium]|nr:hypothetical protein [Solirubrobacteraceae bacterium]
MDCFSKFQVCNGWVTVRAAPGEVNRLTLADTQQVDGVVVRDDGAPLTAGAGCATRDAATVVCDMAVHIASVEVRAGDGDDVVDAAALGYPSTQLHGGPGDDRLVAPGSENAVVGGPGSDVLVGDVDTQARYDDRRTGVRVDLAAGVVTGRGGERDRLEGVGAVLGGAGDDVLVGDGRANAFTGGPGDDRLVGGAGRDSLVGGTGADRLDGGAGDDEIDPASVAVGASGTDRARDRIVCGAGRDRAAGLQLPDLVAGGCERVFVEGTLLTEPLRLTTDLRGPGAPFLRGTAKLCACTVSMAARLPGSGLRVAATRVRLRSGDERPVSLALDARGQALLRRRTTLPVRVRIDEGGAPAGFDTVLRLR